MRSVRAQGARQLGTEGKELNTAAEQFAIQLGRASSRARRHLRGLSSADKDDLLADAMLRCWETRESFDPTRRSVDDWFAETVRESRELKRGRRRREQPRFTSVERLHELAAHEDTARIAESRQLAERVYEKLTDTERAIADDMAAGFSFREIRQRHDTSGTVTRRLYRQLQDIRGQLPDTRSLRTATVAGISREADHPREAAPIDHEIEKMLRRPTTERADCPVCWRCMWFEGLTPKNWSPPRLDDQEIWLAVTNTEQEKIRIAGGSSHVDQ